ncbi:MAG: flagellar basal body-associated FliL family protein [Clostridiales bacterium]|nr:flagellar basal body-associated FliL family protein [Clostridiales bacterium]
MKKIIIIIVAVIVVAGGVTAFIVISKNKPPEIIREYYVPGAFFVTNVKDSKYLLKTTIVLELNQKDKAVFLTDNNHIIRDVIVFTLREKTEEELRTAGIEDELRTEIVEKIKSEMGIDYIETIYFNDYVLQ